MYSLLSKMGPRWALVFCLLVLGIARSAQGDSRFPLKKDSKDKKMMRYGEEKIPEWDEARLNSLAMSDGSQQPFMTQGALARDGMDAEKPGMLARGPKGGGKGGGGKGGGGKAAGGKAKGGKGGKGGKGLTKAERDALAEAARLAAEEKRKRDAEKANQG